MKRFRQAFFLFSFISITLQAQVKLPRLISDGMILQRNAEVKIWGWASPGEKIKVHFADTLFKTRTNDNGQWIIHLPKMESGGPFSMKIKGKNKIIINDILMGDVWLCSGQSNMELPVRRVSWVYPEEIKKCENKYIRQFKVPQDYDFNSRHEDFTGGEWKQANPENIMDFSAVAWFFAKEINTKYKVPVGLINASLGGSPAEAWMSEDALKDFPGHFDEMQRFKDSSLIREIISSDNNRIGGWYNLLNQLDKGLNRNGESWYNPDLNITGWKEIQVPAFWTGTELEKMDGVVWYRKKFTAGNSISKEPALLLLGRIIDADSVFVNGNFVGTTSYQYPPRRYTIPPGILKEGENTITVRVINNQGTGGFVPGKDYAIIGESENINLSGTWMYKIGASMPPLAGQTFIRWKPGGLFNAMIAPLTDYTIKGTIWYQGESNTGRPREYREMFPALINNWRNEWNQGDFPFIYVQLAALHDYDNPASSNNWPLLREAQLKTLDLPNTGMAVTIDIGEQNDVHPLNKKEVGYRLALAARKIAYNEDSIVYSGPIYKSMEKEDGKIVLTFTSTGSGLVFRGNNAEGRFMIAGSDKKFIPAKAKIQGDKIIVWSDSINNPVAVRYGWSDYPEKTGLFNKEGLPASPFRTDEW